ncbi:MAG TPA: hypothetical protein VFS21_23655, partial [Roseiflexaceae bacterium]|nr:hypothetical protein [Roseiflexaceae bacterium]
IADAAQLENLLNNAKIADVAELERLLGNAKIADAAQLENLLNNAKIADAAQLENLLNNAKIADAAQLENLLNNAKIADAAQLENLLNNAKIADAAQLENLLNNAKIADVAELERLLGNAKIADAAELERLLGNAKIGSATELENLLNNAKIADAVELERLLALPEIADAAQLERLIGSAKIRSVAELESLIGLTTDAAQLERLLGVMPSGADLEVYLFMAGGKPQAALFETILMRAHSVSGDVTRVEDLLNLANSNPTRFSELAGALQQFDRLPPTAPPPSNLHGYAGINMPHFLERHTFECFDFGQIKANNTLWPKGTDVGTLVDEALTYLDSQVPPVRLVPFANPPTTVPLSNGMTAQIGLNNSNVIGQFFPIPGSGAINFTRDEMNAFKNILVP